jgi:hypothetical protein
MERNPADQRPFGTYCERRIFMVDPKKASERPSNLEKDPANWTTGNERMTDTQASY